ncbi:hypothetical protein [Novosphingobium aquae]|uniref:Uncharacterized protein n=1 Tax=Novosphingobium aquae TaxID=3133435 RepID=A0ABU8S5T5_9SPHN
MIVNIHGGPEGQSTLSFRGRVNYLLNEPGVAIFYSKVRGSTGFGKRFVCLDNGPFKREDSVKDIRAFLDRLQSDRAIDAMLLWRLHVLCHGNPLWRAVQGG